MKLKAVTSIIILLVLSVTAHAQIGLPCSGDDPDGNCPLDTWVLVLVIAAATFAAYRLYRNKKSEQYNTSRS